MESLHCLAVVPVYEPMKGNVCICYGFTGEVQKQAVTVRAQMRRFFREHRLDEKEYEKNARRILGITKNLPMAYSTDCIFVPVKVRVPVTRGDGAYAYVRLEGIHSVEDHRLHLCTGEPFDCLQSRRSLLESLSRARILLAVLESEEARRTAERRLVNYAIRHAAHLHARRQDADEPKKS